MKELVLVIVLLSLVFLCNCYAFDDEDFQYWNSESISVKLSEDWKAALSEEFRFGDNANIFYYQHSDLGFIYSGIADWIDLAVNYRHIYEKKSNGWEVENRPHLDAVLKCELSSYELANRIMLEYRNRESNDDFWRYRNRFMIKMPFKLTKLKIQPYFADETFYDFDAETLNKNRIYGGVDLVLTKNIKAEIYYLRESTEKNDKWADTNILGTKFKLYF